MRNGKVKQFDQCTRIFRILIKKTNLGLVMVCLDEDDQRVELVTSMRGEDDDDSCG